MRLFFCAELPNAVREELAKTAHVLHQRLKTGTWVDQGNLHITLRFLGEVEEERLPHLRELGGRVACAFPPFALAVERLGAFPSPRRARVLWAGPTEENPSFPRLVGILEEGVQKLGFPAETKVAQPHVTLARFRSPQDLSAALAGVGLRPVPVEIGEITLMRSELRPQGPLYTPLARWKLG